MKSILFFFKRIPVYWLFAGVILILIVSFLIFTARQNKDLHEKNKELIDKIELKNESIRDLKRSNSQLNVGFSDIENQLVEVQNKLNNQIWENEKMKSDYEKQLLNYQKQIKKITAESDAERDSIIKQNKTIFIYEN